MQEAAPAAAPEQETQEEWDDPEKPWDVPRWTLSHFNIVGYHPEPDLCFIPLKYRCVYCGSVLQQRPCGSEVLLTHLRKKHRAEYLLAVAELRENPRHFHSVLPHPPPPHEFEPLPSQVEY
jgi:hypothetical protein